MRKLTILSILLLLLVIYTSKTVFSSEDEFVTVCGDQFCYKGSEMKVKGYNFSRKNLPSWWLHVSNWNENSIIDDLKLAKNNGANTIRIFLPFSIAFSDLEGNIPSVNKDRLLRFIQLAKSEDLKVTITLFVWFADDRNWPYDWPQQRTDFNPNNEGYKNSFSRIDKYINQIVEPLKNEKGIVSWGLFNEPEGTYWDKENNKEGWKLPYVMYFIKHVHDYIKTIDTNHLVTTGVIFHTTLSKKYTIDGEEYSLGDLSDYLSIHEYPKNDVDINSHLNFIKQNSKGKPIVIEEIGWPTADFQNSNGWPDGTTSSTEYTEEKQFERINSGLAAAKLHNIAGFLTWILIDQNIDTIPTKFGLFNAVGSPKQAISLMHNSSLFPYRLFDTVNLPSSPIIPTSFPGCGPEISYVVSDQTSVVNGCNALRKNCSSLGKPYPANMFCHAKFNSMASTIWEKFGPSCTNPYCTCVCIDAPPQDSCNVNINITNLKSNIEFRDANHFIVKVTNTGSTALTGSVIDTIFHDSNCNAISDEKECSSIGLSRCGVGINDSALKQWENVTFAPNETKEFNWSNSNWIPGFCFIHKVSLIANSCKKEINSSAFSSFSNMPLLGGTSFGFVTHLDFSGVEAGNSTQDVDHFKKDIDQWISDSSKIRIVRIAAYPWDIVTSQTTTNINWNQTNLSKIDEAFNYAILKGFKIILTLGPHDNSCGWQTGGSPDCGYGDYNEIGYNNYITRYYSYLAKRWKGKIFIWSPYNESDLTAFTHYFGECKTRSIKGWCQVKDPPPNILTSNEYVNGLNSAFRAIRLAIKTIDPDTKLMVHVASPMNVWYYTINKQIERVSENVDVIGISLYPGNIEKYVNNIPNILDYLRGKFNKPVYLVETGLPEIDAIEPEPRASKTVNFLSKANKHAMGVTYYQFRDDIINLNETPLFGVRKTDETLKPSYFSLINFINNFGWGELKQFQKGWNFIYWPDFNESKLPQNCTVYTSLNNFWWGKIYSNNIYIRCN